ncbi:MAG: NADH-quinone oxidoreductase subunit A [Chloroflexi bacterium]|nr:NADH-quinone oxidoreductase subunit A [Chloroflexota bacterium]
MLERYALDWAAATIGVVVGVLAIGVMFAASAILAPRRPSPEKGIPFESGILPAPYQQSQIHIRYYIFAILFLIFDVEAVFLFPWAVVFMKIAQIKNDAGQLIYSNAVANAVFYEMIIFIAILGFGVAYAWRKGVLQWR